MGGAGRFLQNRSKTKQKFINHVNGVFIKKIDATKHFIIVYKSVLSVFTQECSVVVWLNVRPENEPKKLADIYGSFGPTKKIIFAPVRLPPPP